MPFITTERVKEIRTAIKAMFPNCKFSIKKVHHSEVRVSILEAPIDLMEGEKGYTTVNQYYINEHYKDNVEVRNFLNSIY